MGTFLTKSSLKNSENNIKNRKRKIIDLGTVTATITEKKVFSHPYAVKIVGVSFINSTGRTVDGTDYINHKVVNHGLDGTGVTKVVDETDIENTTFTGGTANVANTEQDLKISDTLTEVEMDAKEWLVYTLTVGGTINLANCALAIDYEDNLA